MVLQMNIIFIKHLPKQVIGFNSIIIVFGVILVISCEMIFGLNSLVAIQENLLRT